MIDTLYVNGCSWTAGNELETDPCFLKMLVKNELQFFDPTNPVDLRLVNQQSEIVGSAQQFYDDFNWASRIKKKLKIKNLINHAAGAGSNARILRTTTEFLLALPEKQRKSVLVVIGWTVNERDEIFLKNHWHYFNSTQKFSTTVDRLTLPDNEFIETVDKFQQDYIVNIQEDIAGVQRYFQGVYLLSNLLENLGIPYYFFSALPQWWTSGPLQLRHSESVDETFPTQVEWYQNNKFIHPMQDNMFTFIHENNYPCGTHLHPLSAGHAAWADHLLVKIKTVI